MTTDDLQFQVAYRFTVPPGLAFQKKEPVAAAHITAVPKPGMTIAVWYTGDRVALLL